MEDQTRIKQQLVTHLKGGKAFSPIDTVLEKMPFDKIGTVPDGLPYSFYQQFAHIQIAQSDILEYCRNDNYKTPNWPDDYWPANPEPENKGEWKNLIDTYFEERKAFCDLLLNEETQLLAPFKSNENHTMLRQAQLIIEHTSYHTGQLYIIHRLLEK